MSETARPECVIHDEPLADCPECCAEQEGLSEGRKLLNLAIAAGAPSDGWTHIDVELDEDDGCPIHGPDEAEGQCWPCHRAACLADPGSCEGWA